MASYEGSKFCDDDDVFANYARLRANAESANDTLNFQNEAVYERFRRVPLFLFMAAAK